MKEYQKNYRQFWRKIIEPKGKFNKQQVMKELYDFSHLLEVVPKILDHATRGAVSKVNITLESFKNIFDEIRKKEIDEAVEKYAVNVGRCPLCMKPVRDSNIRKGWVVCEGETCTWEKQVNRFNEFDCFCHCHMTPVHVVDGKVCENCETDCEHCKP